MTKKETVREHISWSYANLASAHSALSRGKTEYSRINYMIRAKLYKGLLDGTMNMRSIFDDEKVKLKFAHGCSYCGVNEKLQIDHLIPKVKFGSDSADNLVWACRSCNSSKGGRDLLRWLETKNRKPSILLLRRYLKLISLFCEENELMDSRLDEIVGGSIPFDLLALPYKLEPLSDYVLWIGEN